MPGLIIGAEICEDLWTAAPPSTAHALHGATVIVNLSASDETTGKDIYRRELVTGQSARLLCAYIYADAGEGESSTDLVFAGHNLIAENGTLLNESKRFQNGMILSEIDLGRLTSERRRISTFPQIVPGTDESEKDAYQIIHFTFQQVEETTLQDIMNEHRLSRTVRQTATAAAMKFYTFRRWDSKKDWRIPIAPAL